MSLLEQDTPTNGRMYERYKCYVQKRYKHYIDAERFGTSLQEDELQVNGFAELVVV